MKCLNCNGDQFDEKNCRFAPELKGEEVEVVVPAMVCTRCQHALMNDGQMDYMRRVTADAYRKQHGLLTSGEIVNLRCAFGMSQAALATHLNVDEMSVKRWETYFIQDVAQNERMIKL